MENELPVVMTLPGCGSVGVPTAELLAALSLANGKA